MTLTLDGKSLALQVREDLKKQVESFVKNTGVKPGLATILVGEDPASAVYVNMKVNACQNVGMNSIKIEMPKTTTTKELLAEIEKLNMDPHIHGILLQHPVPAQIDERLCFDSIRLIKDVDGVTSQGFGKIAMNEDAYESATPKGILYLLNHYNIPLEGKHAVVVGRSAILGKPVAVLLLNANATVTICHSKTKNLKEIVSQADIVVGAVGRPEFIKGDWIKNGAVVIDAGYHPGKVGDIELSAIKDRCQAYTPVPGGVGPMTIAMLLVNTLKAARLQTGK